MRHWCVTGLIILLAGQPLAGYAAMSAVTLSKGPNPAALKALLTEQERGLRGNESLRDQSNDLPADR